MVVRLQSLRGGYPPEYACSTIQNQTGKTVTDVRATIPPHITRTSNCLGFYATMEPDLLTYAEMSQQGAGLEAPLYLYKGIPSVLSAKISSVAFADGTSWKPID